MVEKETKTKAYSKEGLGASTKLDPAAKEKLEVESWLQDSINSLEIQADQFESEIETISTSGSKKRNKNDKNVSASSFFLLPLKALAFILCVCQ